MSTRLTKDRSAADGERHQTGRRAPPTPFVPIELGDEEEAAMTELPRTESAMAPRRSLEPSS
jgi:hypothetical protein